MRHRLHVALPDLPRRADADTPDLTDVTPGRLRKQQAACRLTCTEPFADRFLSHLRAPCRQCCEDVNKADAKEQP